MFYSHTILARKGPLGTVWCAAHLQHKLKKSHYTSTNIPSTVERIMYPEVPIALRMSGHLLLGVVRIYSKQVEYFYHDCNGALTDLRKAFASVNMNVPEDDTTRAPFHSVTLPETFQLDALELEHGDMLGRYEDNHLKLLEEITLEDQIPTGTDPYIRISIHEATPVRRDASRSGAQPMDEGGRSSSPEAAPRDDPSLGDRAETSVPNPIGDSATEVLPDTENISEIMREVRPDSEIMHDAGPDIEVMRGAGPDIEVIRGAVPDIEATRDVVPDIEATRDVVPDIEVMRDAVPETEIMRDAVHDLHMEDASMWAGDGDDIMEPDRVLEEQMMREKETKSPDFEEMLHSGDASIPVYQAEEPQPSSSKKTSPDLNMSFGHATPELVLRATPIVEQPRAKRGRKRKLFDEATVLSNKFIKKALDSSHDLLRKKRNCPGNNLDIWRVMKRSKKNMFLDPLLTGLSSDLQNLYAGEVISSKPHLKISEETRPEPEVTQSPTHRSQQEVEIEHLRDFEGPNIGNEMSEIFPSPSRFASTPPVSSNIRRDEASPSTINVGSDMDRGETTIGTAVLSTPDTGFDMDRGETTIGTAVQPTPETGSDMDRGQTTIGTDVQPTPDIGSDMQPTPDIASSSGLFGSDTGYSRDSRIESGGLSAIPEMSDTAGELSFLEQDDNTPVGSSRGTPESGQRSRQYIETLDFDKLSARTRAVAQYLKSQSSVTPGLEHSQPLSLNSILEGKTRKIAARMFNETLVLKNYGLIDVNQEAPYADITLKVTSKLSKEQVST